MLYKPDQTVHLSISIMLFMQIRLYNKHINCTSRSDCIFKHINDKFVKGDQTVHLSISILLYKQIRLYIKAYQLQCCTSRSDSTFKHINYIVQADHCTLKHINITVQADQTIH